MGTRLYVEFANQQDYCDQLNITKDDIERYKLYQKLEEYVRTLPAPQDQELDPSYMFFQMTREDSAVSDIENWEAFGLGPIHFEDERGCGKEDDPRKVIEILMHHLSCLPNGSKAWEMCEGVLQIHSYSPVKLSWS